MYAGGMPGTRGTEFDDNQTIVVDLAAIARGGALHRPVLHTGSIGDNHRLPLVIRMLVTEALTRLCSFNSEQLQLLLFHLGMVNC